MLFLDRSLALLRTRAECVLALKGTNLFLAYRKQFINIEIQPILF